MEIVIVAAVLGRPRRALAAAEVAATAETTTAVTASHDTAHEE